MDHARQAVRPRPDFGRGRGTWHGHGGVRLYPALARRGDRRPRGRGLLLASTEIKRWLGYDDSLDVFGVHGVGGILGTTLAGVFTTAAVSAGPDAPNGYPGLLEGNAHQVLIQLYGVGVTVAYCAVVTSVILLALRR